MLFLFPTFRSTLSLSPTYFWKARCHPKIGKSQRINSWSSCPSWYVVIGKANLLASHRPSKCVPDEARQEPRPPDLGSSQWMFRGSSSVILPGLHVLHGIKRIGRQTQHLFQTGVLAHTWCQFAPRDVFTRRMDEDKPTKSLDRKLFQIMFLDLIAQCVPADLE
jgi:hypothetical protein